MSSVSTYDEPRPSYLDDSTDLGSSQDREEQQSWEPRYVMLFRVSRHVSNAICSAPRNLCLALESASKRALTYERHIKDIEVSQTYDYPLVLRTSCPGFRCLCLALSICPPRWRRGAPSGAYIASCGLAQSHVRLPWAVLAAFSEARHSV